MSDGSRLHDLARTRLGQDYRNVLVPKNNPDWKGPWDCAEFASWLVYQIGGKLYGCTDDAGDPALTEAYTGAWQSDANRLGRKVAVSEATRTRGAFLLRFPPAPGSMGHIVVSDGQGGTVEAMGRNYGVCEGRVSGRYWDTGVLIPGFSYDAPSAVTLPDKPVTVYRIGATGMKADVTRQIQTVLKSRGFDPGPIDGEYGALTTAAVAAYQDARGLVVDGQVGPRTARSLGVRLG